MRSATCSPRPRERRSSQTHVHTSRRRRRRSRLQMPRHVQQWHCSTRCAVGFLAPVGRAETAPRLDGRPLTFLHAGRVMRVTLRVLARRHTREKKGKRGEKRREKEGQSAKKFPAGAPPQTPPQGRQEALPPGRPFHAPKLPPIVGPGGGGVRLTSVLDGNPKPGNLSS